MRVGHDWQLKIVSFKAQYWIFIIFIIFYFILCFIDFHLLIYSNPLFSILVVYLKFLSGKRVHRRYLKKAKKYLTRIFENRAKRIYNQPSTWFFQRRYRQYLKIHNKIFFFIVSFFGRDHYCLIYETLI